jgi:hypothetical protein
LKNSLSYAIFEHIGDMMTIEQTVEIPADHRLTLEVPREIPAGRAILTFSLAPVIPAAVKSADTTKKQTESSTPITDRLSGILSHAKDMSPQEIREERLNKYL